MKENMKKYAENMKEYPYYKDSGTWKNSEISPSIWALWDLEKLWLFFSLARYVGNMKKYVGNMWKICGNTEKYVKNVKKYKEICGKYGNNVEMKRHAGNMWKLYGIKKWNFLGEPKNKDQVSRFTIWGEGESGIFPSPRVYIGKRSKFV